MTPSRKSEPREAVFVCQGRKCSRADAHDVLLRRLCKVADVHVVRCQKICEGSVLAMQIGGNLEWFARVDSSKRTLDAVKSIGAKHRRALPKSMKRRRLKRLSGVALRR